MKGGILQHKDSINFILAGNATVTFLNTSTECRFTYRVKKSKTGSVHFVSVLVSPDIYQFIGYISNSKFKYSMKSKISSESKSVIVFTYVFQKLLSNDLNPLVEIWHEGKCGKCGRQLTVPSSIEIGIGPDCLKQMMNKDLVREVKINKILK